MVSLPYAAVPVLLVVCVSAFPIRVPLKRFALDANMRGDPGGVQYEMWAMEGLAIGSPAQPLFLTLDTGSSPMVTFLRRCSTPICVNGIGPRFDSSKSSTYNSSQLRNCLLSYGGGQMDAEQGADVLRLSFSGSLTTVKFAGAFSVVAGPGTSDSIWEYLNPSGLLGISPFSSPDCGQINLLSQLKQAGMIQAPVLGFVYGGMGSAGSLSLGAADKRMYDEPVVWSAEFIVPIANCTLNGRPAPASCIGPSKEFTCYAIPDSGGAYFSADIGFTWTIGADCKGMDQLPTLGVTLNGLTMAFTPEDYVMKTTVNGVSTCVSGLQQLKTVQGGGYTQTLVPDAQGAWLFAGRFNSVVYTIVDMEKGMNGFALVKRPAAMNGAATPHLFQP
jgi:hypothetical protein